MSDDRINKLSIETTAQQAKIIQLTRENERLERANGRLSMGQEEIIDLRRENQELTDKLNALSKASK